MATPQTTTKLALALSATLMASGCASAINGTTETWRAESTPSGAQLTTSTGHQCKTPCALEVKRKDEFTVTIEQEGYAPHVTEVKSGIDGGGAALAFVSVLFGPLGALVEVVADSLSGAIREPEPNPLQVTLVALAEPENAPLALTPRTALRVVRPAASVTYVPGAALY